MASIYCTRTLHFVKAIIASHFRKVKMLPLRTSKKAVRMYILYMAPTAARPFAHFLSSNGVDLGIVSVTLVAGSLMHSFFGEPRSSGSAQIRSSHLEGYWHLCHKLAQKS